MSFPRNPFGRGSQNAQILDYLWDHGSITPDEAYELCRCRRLAARIPEIVAEAKVEIRTEIVRRDRVVWGKYHLEGPVQLDLLAS